MPDRHRPEGDHHPSTSTTPGTTSSDQLDDLVKVADLAGHVDTRTTEGYRHSVRPALPHAVDAWNGLLERRQSTS